MHFPRRRYRRRIGLGRPHVDDSDPRIDELLELIWTLDEEGKNQADQLTNIAADPWVRLTLNEMVSKNLISISNGLVKLEQRGMQKAKQIIRRHRLAERLLSEVLEVSEATMEASACKFEHALNPEVTDSICTLLGHPPTCPHGKPIPRGKCCERFTHEVKPLLVRLSDLSPGQEATISFIAPRYHSRLDRLGSFGIIPGSRIRLHQKEPAIVIQIDETDLAIDKNIAREIYVRVL